MKKGTIGAMLMMVKKEIAEQGVYAVMEQLKDIGINLVEVSQIPMTAEFVSELQRACRDLHMEIGALSCGLNDLTAARKYPGDTLANDFDKIVADCKTLDCTTLRIGMMPVPYMESEEAGLEFIRLCEDYAIRLKEHGIRLYYHPHHMEMVKYNGKRFMDTMRDVTTHVGFELDTHWMWRGGVDPVEYIKTFKGRIYLLHLKDYRIAPVNFASYHVPEEEKMEYMFDKIVQFAEVGEGVIDYPNVLRTAVECGTRYFHIEQDDCYGRNPMDSIRLSYENLVKMGFKDWFELE